MCGYCIVKIEEMVERDRAMERDEKSKIKVQGLHYSIDFKEILKNVDFQIEEGRMVGIIGPNGSGKTTTLKHIYRALEPQRETVYIDGRDIHQLSYKEAAQEITVMKQENASDFEYTIYEMVMMGRTPHRNLFQADTKEDKEVVRNALRYVGMEKEAERYYTELSGGEKQRVMIARSLAQGTEIFILDEPTNHLDVHYQWALIEIIKSLQKTVVAVFHELNLAAAYCEEIFVMKDGSIVAHGSPREVLTKEMLAEVFRIDADIIEKENGQIYIVYNRSL